jgi:hypothetical protein
LKCHPSDWQGRHVAIPLEGSGISGVRSVELTRRRQRNRPARQATETGAFQRSLAARLLDRTRVVPSSQLQVAQGGVASLLDAKQQVGGECELVHGTERARFGLDGTLRVGAQAPPLGGQSQTFAQVGKRADELSTSQQVPYQISAKCSDRGLRLHGRSQSDDARAQVPKRRVAGGKVLRRRCGAFGACVWTRRRDSIRVQ